MPFCLQSFHHLSSLSTKNYACQTVYCLKLIYHYQIYRIIYQKRLVAPDRQGKLGLTNDYADSSQTISLSNDQVAGNTKGGSITVQLTSYLTCLDQSVLQIKTIIVNCHTADSKPVKQEVNSTVILPSLVFPARQSIVITARNQTRRSLVSQIYTMTRRSFVNCTRKMTRRSFVKAVLCHKITYSGQAGRRSQYKRSSCRRTETIAPNNTTRPNTSTSSVTRRL